MIQLSSHNLNIESLALTKMSNHEATSRLPKSPPTIENIPEDVTAIIAEAIKSWAVGGSLNEIDEGRR